MHFNESGHSQHLMRYTNGRGRLPHNMGDQIEGRGVVEKKEPELIRQKPPQSPQDKRPNPVELKKTVRCRQVIRAGHPKVIPLVQARGKFQSHQLKCQQCSHHLLCAA